MIENEVGEKTKKLEESAQVCSPYKEGAFRRHPVRGMKVKYLNRQEAKSI